MLLISHATLWLAATLAQADAFPAVRVEDEAFTYPIVALSARGINAQLRRYADSADHPEHGHTSSHFELRSALDAKAGQCSLASLAVSVHIRTTLPRWNSAPNAPAALRNEWDAAFGLLQRHEAGHRGNAIAGARALRDAVLALPPQSSCLRLQMLLDLQAQKFRDLTAERDDRFDLRTSHGLRDDPRLDQPPRPIAARAVADAGAGDDHRRKGRRSPVVSTYSAFLR